MKNIITKKSCFLIYVTVILYPLIGTSQVGIGTTNPDASARLEVSSTNKGFLPPRMTTTERDAISSPANGLIIFNITNNCLEIRSGSSWMTLVTLTGNETLTNKTLSLPVIASGNNQFANSLSILPTTHATSRRAAVWIDGWSFLQDLYGNGEKNFSIGQTVSGTYPSRFFISTIGNIGIGNVTPNARLDVRTTPSSTSDPGAGYLGIGTTTTAASSAGAGAMRYSTNNGGVVEYSDGSTWKPLAASKTVAVYTEVHTDAGSGSSYSAGAAFNEFNTITADNVVAVYGSSYGFFNGTGSGSSGDKWVAPFTGKYRITTNAYFNHNVGYSNPRLYAFKNNSSICNITSATTGGQDIATSTSAIISMNQGDFINWKVDGSGASIYRGLYHTFFRIESVE
jgi:hypothetical protein